MRMTSDESRRRVTGERVARLATTGNDLQPHLVPITYALVDDQLITAVDHKPKTTTHLRRLDNIEQNPKVAVLWDHYDEDWQQLWWVRADGLARVLTDALEHQQAIAALAERYQPYRDQPPAGPVIIIDIHHWTGWAYR